MSSLPVDLRCSSQARAIGADPVGTAVASDAFLLVEVPLPWPADIADHPALAGVGPLARSLGARVQGVVPSPANVADGQSDVVLYSHSRASGSFVAYERREVSVDLRDLASGCGAAAGAAAVVDDARDLLVCTHGARDRCCGSLGTALFAGVRSRPGLRVRRTSHTGGHRFAPNVVLLPEGTVWGWLDDALLDAIVDRDGMLDDVLPHYRGSTAMATPTLQVAERAVFAEVGWSWLSTPRSGAVVDVTGDGDRSVVRIDSVVGSWEAVVDRLATRPQPVCGAEPSPGGKVDDILRLVDLRSIDTAGPP